MSRGADREALRERGFTLVEVMLTLLIMAGIMVTITKVLTGVRRTRDEIHNIQERQLAGPAVLQRIERDLRALFLYDRDRRYVLRIRDRVTSGLDADTLDFVATTDGLMPWQENAAEAFRSADWNEVGYRLRSRPGDDEFLELYRREDFGVDDAPFDGGRFGLLSDRVKGFNIEVYEEDGPDAEPLESWDGEQDEEFLGLPARIEIALTIEMAPRLTREQLIIDRRTLVYRRTFRFPEILRRQIETAPVPIIPVISPPTPESGATEGGGNETGGGGNENPFGR